jgi:4-hydroxy-tetrahydrodipicolinate synthase
MPAGPFGRVVTAMATPFTAEGALDAAGAAELAGHLVEHRTDTVLVGGTTGESPTISSEELVELIAVVKEAVGHRGSVMAGTGTNDTRKTVELTGRATDAGVEGVLVVTPYYNKPSQRGLLEHFRAAAEATDRPVVLYDIPGRTQREIDRETIISLAEVDNIVGVKDAVGDLQKTSEVVAGTSDDFHVYCGADELNLPMLAVGASGFISVAAHVAGERLAEMAEVFGSDPARAEAINRRLLPLYRALFLEPNPAPLKAILNDLGLPAGPVRPPLVDATEGTLATLREALEQAGIRHAAT